MFIFYLYWYSYIVLFVCDSASELEQWALLPFWGFPALTCILVFLDMLFLGTCYIFFRKCWDFLWVFFYLFPVPYFELACDHGNSSLCLEESEREGTG